MQEIDKLFFIFVVVAVTIFLVYLISFHDAQLKNPIQNVYIDYDACYRESCPSGIHAFRSFKTLDQKDEFLNNYASGKADLPLKTYRFIDCTTYENHVKTWEENGSTFFLIKLDYITCEFKCSADDNYCGEYYQKVKEGI